MFSVKQKQYLAKVIEDTLLVLNHPEMPEEKPSFKLHVDGKEGWSWADIEPNWLIAQQEGSNETKQTMDK